ncbi:2-succinyl-5-enolpyruvyl-6-hydroxy-3-cyclohexene-1-carboxylate synthase [Gracilariopsis chorda]|uniref:isochorismate synthase n=1 Tax=Gracilariopsis chorda TaxID=448386 RepID=A0A2V3IS28_9FLOR|nr:2-succinyl-5-enolpyruvyl-6-hydroxy-3-cyclohexene-1-carboxylate synthase [Gracilariopsis chorda]|eukprot:PXF43910.1 2-succinyl-5-enolpyruvyl-6-hydroxy-3-cyclohexene-1-carboxylate synthase [Gracilariopsis chorda]
MTEQLSISFQCALNKLWDWTEYAACRIGEAEESGSQYPRAHRKRIQIEVCFKTALVWLRAQPHAQKLYFRSRDNTFEIAAVGFSHVSSDDVFRKQTHQDLVSILNPEHPEMKFYGASRFDSLAENATDLEWQDYSGYTFVLPAVELYRDVTNDFYLAVNYYPPSGISVLFEALRVLVPLATYLQTARQSSLIPTADQVLDLPGYGSWEASMERILKHLKDKQYHKLVLARRKVFEFQDMARPDPIHVLAALDETDKKRHVIKSKTSPQNLSRIDTGSVESCREGLYASRDANILEETCDVQRSYAFCLQVADGRAFISHTPETLFRIAGGELKTEALAGTVRRGPDEEEAFEIGQLFSEKNLDEHGFVVRHVTNTLSECNLDAETWGPHVRKLARLMHLVTNIESRIPYTPSCISDTIYQVLHRLHPTPAVCGAPCEKARSEIRELEGFDRGLFAGPLGWFSRDAAEFCVAIRSAVFYGNKVVAFAGSGIVPGSEAKSEWDETELKMSAFSDLFSIRSEMDYLSNNCQTGIVQHGLTNGFQNSAEDSFPSDRKTGAFTISSSVRDNCLVRIQHLTMNSEHEKSAKTLPLRSIETRVGTSGGQMSAVVSQLGKLPNLNAVWSFCCVEELCRNGIDTFFIAPGSRSAPLAVAVVTSRHARYFVSHDERGAGFLAVGYARGTSRAAVVITSSGTAVANLLPAAVEAYSDSLPVILLTADRPPELRDIGANQTIDQVGVFGKYVLWSVDVPCPSEEIPLGYLLKRVDTAVRMSGSFTCSRQQQPQGPVHINMMFRENLAPDEQVWNRSYLRTAGSRWLKSLCPSTTYQAGGVKATQTYIERKRPSTFLLHHGFSVLLKSVMNEYKGVIITAGGCGAVRTEGEVIALREIASLLDWPVISDVCGGLRLGTDVPNVIHYANLMFSSAFFRSQHSFRVVLQFGERITSKSILKLIEECSRDNESFLHALVSPSSKCSDSALTVTHRVECDVSEFLIMMKSVANSPQEVGHSTSLCNGKHGHGDLKSSSSKLKALTEVSTSIDKLLDEATGVLKEEFLTEPGCARVITRSILAPCALFIGNSMPIRDFDQFSFARTEGGKLRVAANRGASGIDGLVSTGIGFGIGLNLDVVIILGDMSMIHDLNALHLLREHGEQLPIRVTVIVINNGGGGIFSMLPISKHPDVFSPVFDTPHSLDFRSVCCMFGIEYIPAKTAADLSAAISRVHQRHCLIEAIVSKDHQVNAALHEKLRKIVDQGVGRTVSKSGPESNST